MTDGTPTSSRPAASARTGRGGQDVSCAVTESAAVTAPEVSSPPGPGGASAPRDSAVDAARVGCVIAVVCIHVLFVALTADPATGELSAVRVPESMSWYPAATWVLQIMPLFFVVGGATGVLAWRRRRAAGMAPAEYVRERMLRLNQPAAVLWCTLAVGALVALAAGVDGELVTFALAGMGMALWFLAAYGICQALLPVFTGLHERLGWLWCWVLLSGVVVVDLVRIGSHEQWWGLINMVFVWPLIQQFGFFRADGWFAARSTVSLVLLAVLGYAVVAVCVVGAGYAPDMLTNLNPPTLCLVGLGFAQACLLQVATPALERLMRTRPAQLVAYTVGSRAMTVYLWHLPVIVVVMAAWFFVGGYDPVPGSAQWWVFRIPLAALCWAAVLALATALVRFEHAPTAPWRRSPATRLPSWLVLMGVLCAVVPALLEIVTLLHPALCALGALSTLWCVVSLRWAAVAPRRSVVREVAEHRAQ